MGKVQKEIEDCILGDLAVLDNTMVVHDSTGAKRVFFQEQSFVSRKLDGVGTKE